jgi:large subunit ribosomal protein L18
MTKNNARIRSATKSRATMAYLGKTRLSIHRSNANIYAQVIDGKTNKIIASASTVEADVKKKLKNTSDTNAATEIGKRIADKAIKAGVKVVAFDRSGYRYHGRVKALADSARENGLTF